MVVPLPTNDRKGAIQLLQKNHPNHLVGKGHSGKAHLHVSSLVNFL